MVDTQGVESGKSKGKRPGPHVERRLSAAFVKSAPPGRHTDGGGLYLVVSESGARRWLLRLVVKGARRDLGLGSASLVSLAEARERAFSYRRIARSGGDPTEERFRVQPETITFAVAASQVHEVRIKAHSRNGKHVDQWINTLRTYAFPVIGQMGVDEITHREILAVLQPIWMDKEETARRVFQRLKTVLDWSIVNGYREAENPVPAVKTALHPQKNRVRHFAAVRWEETTNLYSNLEAVPGTRIAPFMACAARFAIGPKYSRRFVARLLRSLWLTGTPTVLKTPIYAPDT